MVNGYFYLVRDDRDMTAICHRHNCHHPNELRITLVLQMKNKYKISRIDNPKCFPESWFIKIFIRQDRLEKLSVCVCECTVYINMQCQRHLSTLVWLGVVIKFVTKGTPFLRGSRTYMVFCSIKFYKDDWKLYLPKSYSLVQHATNQLKKEIIWNI